MPEPAVVDPAFIPTALATAATVAETGAKSWVLSTLVCALASWAFAVTKEPSKIAACEIAALSAFNFARSAAVIAALALSMSLCSAG